MFINDEAQKQILPIIARTTVNPSTDLQERAGSLLQLNPGQQVKAEIIANLPNSLYLARIAGELYKLEIPINVQPGETMDMTFVGSEPRITFQVFRQPEGSASVNLSPVGKWLALALQAPSLPSAQEALLENPYQGSTLLALRLKEVLTQSGLFYESHLAQWAAGGLQLAEILKEPQGKLSRAAGGEKHEDGAADSADAEVADARTLPLIKEQLHLLDSGVLSWRGEAWPGQGMVLSVTNSGREEGEAGIEATLSLSLPNLGDVEAKLHLGAEGLSVELVSDQPGASSVMKEGHEALRSALSSAGLHLARLAAKDVEST